LLFDPKRYVDEATYQDAKRSPDGVLGVWVRGERVVAEGAHGCASGGVIRARR
jgi:hypothetical protein